MSSTFTIGIGVLGAVASLVYLFASHLVRYETRVAERLDSSPAMRGRSRKRSLTDELAGEDHPGTLLTWIRSIAPKKQATSQVVSQLHQAGIYEPAFARLFPVVRVGLMIVPLTIVVPLTLAGTLSQLAGLVIGGITAGLCMLAPGFLLNRRIATRKTSLRMALPDFLDLMIVCLNAGLSVESAIQQVTEEMEVAHPTLAAELNKVQSDIQIGTTVDAAIMRFAERSQYEGIRALATLIRETRRFGTSIAEAMHQHADTLRKEREFSAEEKAQKAVVKIVLPTLLLIMPATLVVLAGPAAIQIQEAFVAQEKE